MAPGHGWISPTCSRNCPSRPPPSATSCGWHQDMAGSPQPAPGTAPLGLPPSPGQFWRLSHSPGDWAWGVIYQALRLLPNRADIYVQRRVALPILPGRPRVIARAGHPTLLPVADFTARCTHRLLVHRGRSPRKGTIRLEVTDSPCRTPMTAPVWSEHLRSALLPTHTWSVYADSSRRANKPIQARALFVFFFF